MLPSQKGQGGEGEGGEGEGKRAGGTSAAADDSRMSCRLFFDVNFGIIRAHSGAESAQSVQKT